MTLAAGCSENCSDYLLPRTVTENYATRLRFNPEGLWRLVGWRMSIRVDIRVDRVGFSEMIHQITH